MKTQTTFTIKTPGRICLFGDHQDYLGLPVIACAINREVRLHATVTSSENFIISLPDIGITRTIAINEAFDKLPKNDHYAAALRVLRRKGCIPNRGYDIRISSTIPINAGVSSSSAIIVAWIHFLLKAFGGDSTYTAEDLAQVAYEAEVLEHNSPGGRMDQYTIAIGNIIYIDTSKDRAYEVLGSELNGLVLGESGEPKETLGLLSSVRSKTEEAIAIAKEQDARFQLASASLHEAETFSETISKELLPYFYAAVQNHTITLQAQLAFKNGNPDPEVLGQLMTAHHEILRDNLHITTARIDAMIKAALEAGAYGAKIVGSGGGGSIVALAPTHKTEGIAQAMKKAGAKDAYPVSVTPGSRSF